MEQNPYESPHEANHRQDFNWRRLSSIGLGFTAPCFLMMLIIPTFTFFPKENPVFAVVTTWGFLFCVAGFFIGGIAALVGWIGSAASRPSQRHY